MRDWRKAGKKQSKNLSSLIRKLGMGDFAKGRAEMRKVKGKIIIGIDPGLSGGIAVLESTSMQLMKLVDMPVSPEGNKRKVNGYGLMTIFGGYTRNDVEMVYLEKVGAMPGQGVVSMFNFGRSYGAVESAVSLMGFPLTYVTPQSWKRRAGLTGSGKDASRGKVLDLYPDADVHRKKDNGRADAVLIARYGEKQA